MKKVMLVTENGERLQTVDVHYVGAFEVCNAALCGAGYAYHKENLGEPKVTTKRITCIHCRSIKNHVLGVSA